MARPSGPARPVEPETPLRFVRGIGPARAEALAGKGYRTVEDLLLHLPFRYEDRSRFTPIASLRASSERVTVSGRVLGSKLFTTARRRMRIVRALVDDGSAAVECLWFNQPFIKDHLKEGAEVILYGAPSRAKGRPGALQMQGPEWELVTRERGDEIHTGRIIPVHRRLPGLSPKALRRILHDLLAALPEDLADPLPEEMRRRLDLPPRGPALRQVHFPDPEIDLELLQRKATPAHRRMIFEELFLMQVALALSRRAAAAEKRAHKYELTAAMRARLRGVLPFRLMGAQRRALQQIADDLRSPRPMNRLLQGDVGSGKTIVAILALLMAVENGYQGALMAPTEILAEQHFHRVQQLLQGRGYRVVLLTGRSKGAARRQLLAGIAGGFWQIVVGTHALIQEAVRFHSLGLVVVDEQHRFGVLQRRALRSKGPRPDVLIMTATPIPRSLCMTLYGDLDLSVIDEMPPGRGSVRTVRRKSDARGKILEFVRREIRRGRQAYVVLPLVEETEASDLKAAVRMARDLGRAYPDTAVGLVHGRMDPGERGQVMREFEEGRIELLVSTTVVEVGIDVPNATVMVIENAERFGLSQLHQLRGRVGRGHSRSYCVLVEAEELSPEAEQRLAIMESSQDGFKIAEKDLEIRGPGEMAGTRQTGLPELRVANLVRDRRLLELAREEASRLVPDRNGDRTAPDPELLKEVRRQWGRRLSLVQTG